MRFDKGDMKPVMTAREAAEYLGMHPKTLKSRVYEGKLRCLRETARSRMRFPREYILEYLQRITIGGDAWRPQ